MTFTRELVRQLKGPALSVLLILALERAPVSQAHIRRHSGYSDEAVSDALAYLKDLGYVTNGPGRYDWRIAIAGMQPPLPAEATALEDGVIDQSAGDPALQPTAQPVEKPVENFTEVEPSSGKSGASSGNTGAALNNDKYINHQEKELIIINSSSGKSGAAEILQVLEAAGIAGYKAKKLASLPHVTRRCVRYHTLTAKKIGFAIHQIENNWPVPAYWVDPDDRPAEVPEETPAASQPAAEPLQPLSPDDLALWRSSVGQLVCSRAELSTWLAIAPDGISEAGAWVIRCANRYGAEWIHTNARASLETSLNKRLQLEVPDKCGRWVKFENTGES